MPISIGSVTGLTVTKGILERAAADYAIFIRAGVDATGVICGSQTDRPQTITTIEIVDDVTAAETQGEAYRALQRTAVTITDQFGRSFANAQVLSVKYKIYHCLSDDGGAMVVASWTVILDTAS